MTTATTEGRRLVLRVDGIDEPFFVNPISAKRGKILTEQFVRASTANLTGDDKLPQEAIEQIFIEAFNPANYSRMAGLYVDEFDAAGAYVGTWTGDGIRPTRTDAPTSTPGIRYVPREELDTETELDDEPIRQEEAESLCLCAFYWQTVVGLEAVNAFIEAGEGMAGSVKALGLLRIRTTLSTPTSSSSSALESMIQEQANSSATPDTSSSRGSVLLPANKRGFMQNPAKPSRKNRR